MSEKSSLVPQVLPAKTHDRARRRHLLFAASAAAIGGAVGSGIVVLGALSLAPVPHKCETIGDTVVTIGATPAPVVVDISPTPLIEVSTPPASPRGRPAAILHADSERLVLDVNVDAKWLKATKPRLVESDDIHFVLERDIDMSALPDGLAALAGQPVTVFDKDGATCKATVGRFSAVRVAYDDYLRPEADGDVDKLAEAWDWGAPTLVATIEGVGDCDKDLSGAVIGSHEIKAAPIRSIEKTELATAAVKSWRNSRKWALIQRDYRSADNKGSWEQGVEPGITLIGNETSGLVIVNLDIGACGEFEGALTHVYQVENGELGERIAVKGELELSITSILGAADSNGDGLPEVITHNENFTTDLLTSADGRFTASAGPDVTVNFCRC